MTFLFRHPLRVLILNCPSGRSEVTFATTIKESLANVSESESSVFFDRVIFSTDHVSKLEGGAWQK